MSMVTWFHYLANKFGINIKKAELRDTNKPVGTAKGHIINAGNKHIVLFL